MQKNLATSMYDLDSNTLESLHATAQNLKRMLDEIDFQPDVYFSTTHPLAQSVREEFEHLGRLLYQASKQHAFEPSDALQQPIAKFIESPVFIGGVHKSGTTLIRNLLDGHPNLLTLPTDGRGYRWLKAQQANDPQAAEASICQELVKIMIMPIGGVQPTWILGQDIQAYLQFIQAYLYWHRQFQQQENGLLKAMVYAFYMATNASPSRTISLWAEKSTENITDAETLLRLFPQARFIHIVRHPASVIAAQKRKQPVKGKTFKLFQEISLLQKGMRLGISNHQHLGTNRYYILRYEDLVTQPEEAMVSVANFLQIPFDPILLRPTVNAHPAGSNTAYKEQTAAPGKILTASVAYWQQTLTPPEIQLILQYFSPLLKFYGYEAVKSWAVPYLIGLLRTRKLYQQKREFQPISLMHGLRMWFQRS